MELAVEGSVINGACLVFSSISIIFLFFNLLGFLESSFCDNNEELARGGPVAVG